MLWCVNRHPLLDRSINSLFLPCCWRWEFSTLLVAKGICLGHTNTHPQGRPSPVSDKFILLNCKSRQTHDCHKGGLQTHTSLQTAAEVPQDRSMGFPYMEPWNQISVPSKRKVSQRQKVCYTGPLGEAQSSRKLSAWGTLPRAFVVTSTENISKECEARFFSFIWIV